MEEVRGCALGQEELECDWGKDILRQHSLSCSLPHLVGAISSDRRASTLHRGRGTRATSYLHYTAVRQPPPHPVQILWLASSPDFNSIETIWNLLKTAIAAPNPRPTKVADIIQGGQLPLHLPLEGMDLNFRGGYIARNI